MPQMPKSQYKFTPYLYGPRPHRAFLEEGGDVNAIDRLMDMGGGYDAALSQVEEYFGHELPGYVRDQGFRTDFDVPGANTGGVMTAHRTFNGPGAHLALAGETVPRIPPDMLDWRNTAREMGGPAAAPAPEQETPEPPAGLPTDMTDVARRQIEQLKQYPTMKEPKWYQRLGSAAAGFGAGWSNAASRTKHPIDIGAMSENILHPGYAEKVAAWRAGMTPLQAEAEIQGGLQGARLKQEQIEGQRLQREATADWRKRQADPHYGQIQVPPEIGRQYSVPDENGTYWMDKTDLAAHIRNQKEAPARPVHVAPGGALVDSSGKVLFQNPAKPPAPRGGTLGAYIEANGGDIRKGLEQFNQDRIAFHAAMKNTAEKAGVKPAQFAAIEAAHQNDYAKVEHDFSAAMQAAAKAPDDQTRERIKKAAVDALDSAKKRIESGYVARIAALTGGNVSPAAPAPRAPTASGKPIRQSPTSVVLPDGRTKHFPNEAATNAFLQAAQ